MNIRDIAKMAGVSVSTVSKVMNNKSESISQETREKVLRIAKEYHYTPYASVITPRTKSFQIGVLLRRFSLSQTILSGVLSEAQAAGYSVTVAESGDSAEEELKAIALFCRNQVDAVLWEATFDYRQGYGQLQAAGIPVYLFHSDLPDAYNIDYGRISYDAVQTLVDRGHRDIACVLADKNRTPGFFKGYKRCLFENQLPFREELVFRSVDTSLFYQIVTHGISAIVCSHYSEAIKLYERCTAFHYSAPEDFSIISMKGDDRDEPIYPQISTYTIPHVPFGRFLCRRAVQAIERCETPEETFVSDVPLDNTSTIDIPPAAKSAKITVVGSVNIDYYLNVASLPQSGKAVRTTISSVYPGGKGTNEAIGAAKLGHAVSLVGNVGDDMDANLIYDALREHGVDADGLRRCTDQLTGKAYIIVEAGGESLVSILSGASEQLRPEDLRLRERSFENTGYALINTEIPMETVAEACVLTHRHGGRTIVKPAACTHIPEEILKDIDILIPNRSEMDEIAPELASLAEKADYFLRHGVQIVIVTLDADGCYLKTPSEERYFPAMDFVSIDSTGAGDAFVSTFASYMLYGYSLEQAIRIAGYGAGFCITREGTVPALIDKNTLEAYIGQKEPELLN